MSALANQRGMRLFAVMIGFALASPTAALAEEITGASLCVDRPHDRLCPAMPHDVPGQEPEQQHLDFFSWQSFVALHWPAKSDGTPDAGKKIGEAGRVVWQALMDPGDVFLSGGGKPVWTPADRSLGCALTGRSAGRRSSTGFSKASLTLAAVLRPAEVSAGIEEFLEAGLSQPLIDRHLNYAVFEIRLNRDAFDDIVNKRYYDASAQIKAKTIDFTGGAIDGPVGAVEIKIAWRVFPPNPSPELLARYFVVDSSICIPAEHSATGKPLPIRDVRLGMVGFHILHKTESRPQWIWSTFEHVDNVAVGPDAPTRLLPTFFDPSCPEDRCPPNKPPRVKTEDYRWEEEQTEDGGYARLHRNATNVPSQATRVDDVPAVTKRVNLIWQKQLANTVFRFYELIGTQWPTMPKEQPLGRPQPVRLANTTMETYLPKSSCLVCHESAKGVDGTTKSDFSFLPSRACPSDPKHYPHPISPHCE